ncbi:MULTISPECIES: ExeM/NucH family extracellular endonuclease [unclassified Microbacterium]|uniref:ExeM/NucH family extracellular endonuclease n=1 Tax=unclassified Microbacterium TaxID=2609290 RepID=UPI000EAA01C2|nr:MULTISPECIES: ExeM/NucH family extracellular endonuclease [unclassified Microbacterium]MBT2485087.1 ExeM/NucH family extracellular endonuclease [Microbacterium sp. ISL-108]RKN67930.1 ExeM/NucH family extracellular endonuclease [Microbacterium sp. CGR2]
MTSAPDENRAVPVTHRRNRGRIGALAVTCVAALGFGSLTAVPAVAAPDGSGVVINEAYLSGGSAGAAFKNKFVELHNPTSAPVTLDGMSLQYRSATGTGNSNGVAPLTGVIPAGGHYLVQANSNGANGAALPEPDAVSTLTPSGTTGTLALVEGTAAVNLTPGSVVGVDGVIDVLGYGTSKTFEAKAATAPAGNTDVKSLNRTDGVDTDDNSADFSLSASITPQASGGTAPDPDPDPDPDPGTEPATATIAEVQGTTDVSPLSGKTVKVEGVVTADYRTGGYKGIVIQTQGSGGATDATPGASDGVFVFLNALAPTLAVGDLVSVTGSVSEYFGQTQLNPATATDITVVTAGVGVPAVTPLPATVVGSDREQYENMYVAPEGTYRLASSHQLFNFGTLWLNAGDELNVKSTETVRPGDEASAIAAANRANRVLLDDGWSIQVSNNGHPGEQPYFTEDVVVRNGDTVDFSDEGYVLQWGFNDWRLQPTVPIDDSSSADLKVGFEATNPRPSTAPEVGGDAQVASFNVYNYFTTLKSENSNARGAANAAQFAIQKSKIVAAINGLDAEIVSLMEIENSVKLGKPIDAALKDLVAGLNDDAGSEVWDYVPTPAALNSAATTDYITNAIIYKKDAVTTVGDSATITDETVWGNAREPIAQAFDIDGRVVTVVANHFKSKSPPEGAGAEPADGQGFFNADRVKQSNALLAFTAELEETSGSSDMLLIGDFNAYGKEDPIDVFTSKGWTDVAADQAPGQYSYTFDGELGSLDHVIASPSLTESITGAGIWGINSPEWSDRGYAYGATEEGTPYRSSDHDPIIVGVSSEIPPVSIDVVTINDFHGRLEADGAAAGAAVVAGAVDQFREANPNTIFAGAGDLIGASTFTSFINDDNPTIDALNAAGLEVSSAGNHEFDQGWEDLRDRVQDRAEFEYIASNVFVTETGEPALAPSWVKELDGVKVGFIGAVTEDLGSLVSPDGIADLEVRSIVESVNAVADDLRDGDAANGEADVIILLAHEGAESTALADITEDSPLGEIVYGVDEDVDAIVSSHTHLAYNHVIDGRPVVSAGQYGENLGLMNAQVDPETKELISITNEIKPLTAAGKPLYPADPEVAAIVAKAKADADVLGAVKVGDITADLNRARQSDGKTENRGGESTIGNFVADVQKWSTGADVALMNPGGIRANLTFASAGASDPDGNVTYREAATVQPFANTLVTLTLTGDQLKGVLEEQWQPAGSARPFLKLGVSEGLVYTYDPAAAQGSRITSITLDGSPIDPQANYTVAANSFLAGGGDNFATFKEGADKRDTGKIDLQSMVDWFDANKTASPDYAQRAVGVSVSAADADGYSAGDQVTVSLSSLAFSAGEPAPGEVSLSLGDAQLAAGAIDPTVVDATDEVGRASLTFTVPSGVFGEQQLTVAVAGTGTTVQVPFTIAGEAEFAGTIDLGSSKVAAGKKLALTGEGYQPGETVTVELRPKKGQAIDLGTVQVEDDGTFAASPTVPKNTQPGKYTVAVSQADGDEATATVTVNRAGGVGSIIKDIFDWVWDLITGWF